MASTIQTTPWPTQFDPDYAPFDEERGVVPNEMGRVAAGLYVVGWIKRGSHGFIGTKRVCAQETVKQLIEDYNSGVLVTHGVAA